MVWGLWLALALYLLGVVMYLTILEATDEEADPNAVLYTAFLWPYVAVRVTLDRSLNGDYDDDDYKDD
jgi:hypothetical protein